MSVIEGMAGQLAVVTTPWSNKRHYRTREDRPPGTLQLRWSDFKGAALELN